MKLFMSSSWAVSWGKDWGVCCHRDPNKSLEITSQVTVRGEVWSNIVG